MEINHSQYIGSFPTESQGPRDQKPEFAFMGRSNVGKSSLINLLCQRRELARISKKPGKTQYLNFYLIDNTWYIVDLPGYGYAKVSKTKRHEWRRMIEGYLLRRKTLQCVFQLIDANVPPQKKDLDFVNWMGKMRVPFVLAFTKTDGLKPSELETNVEAFKQKMLETWEELPRIFITSVVDKIGREEILKFISEVNKV